MLIVCIIFIEDNVHVTINSRSTTTIRVKALTSTIGSIASIKSTKEFVIRQRISHCISHHDRAAYHVGIVRYRIDRSYIRQAQYVMYIILDVLIDVQVPFLLLSTNVAFISTNSCTMSTSTRTKANRTDCRTRTTFDQIRYF
jgi:NADH:ubiquinone oxidoreductase subunit 3 (subunit A)